MDVSSDKVAMKRCSENSLVIMKTARQFGVPFSVHLNMNSIGFNAHVEFLDDAPSYVVVLGLVLEKNNEAFC